MLKKILFVSIIISVALLSAHPKFGYKNDFNSINHIVTRADSAHGFDILKYEIEMEIDDAEEYIQGAVTATVIAEEDLAYIQYELASLNVDDVLVNGLPATYDHIGEMITIDLVGISQGEQFSTRVEYSGNPQLCTYPYALGMFFSTNGIYTISDPNASRYWWPCYDHPWDKAEMDLEITVREDWNVATNGVRIEIIDNGDGTRTHVWDGQNPMATYLVSIVTRVLLEITDEYNGIPIQNFVPPSYYDEALEDLSGLPEMMSIYWEKYGEYPFEKYGNSVTSFSTYGAMEHQTMTTLASYLITGNHTYDTVITHELSHQWFGDCLTPLTWKDVWLSEGFAVYSEAIFIEGTQGFQAMVDYVNSNLQAYYINWAGGNIYTIYDPPYTAIFTPVTYEKAASVLHMLRLMFGSDLFFQILQEYFETFKNGNVVTEDFKQVCEDQSGMDLEQFFNQWIFSPGLPSMEYCYFINPEQDELMSYLKTSSNSETDFYLQVPLHINYEAGSDSVLVDAIPNEAGLTIVNIQDQEVNSVDFDPNGWILSRFNEIRNPEISMIYGGDSRVIINWVDFWDEVEVEGFNLYRSEQPDQGYSVINEEPITENQYVDETVTNGITYYYRIKAVKTQGFETPFSEYVSATPTPFPMDQGILVVDETMDGAGIPGNPDDLMVDEFYENIINSDFTAYDYSESGSPDLEFLADYSLIIWHDDDLSQHQLNNNLDKIGSYLTSGGNLLISGWKTAYVLDLDFTEGFLGLDNIQLVTDFVFSGTSSDQYPDMLLDGDKINPAFNNTLPFITIFPEQQGDIFYFEAIDDSTYDGEICGLKESDFGNIYLLGFPLYYFQESDATLFMDQILDETGNSDIENPNLILPYLSAKVFPNPFNPSTTISFNLPAKQIVSVNIYNMKGEIVKRLVSRKELSPGNHQLIWNGSNENDKIAGSGIYFYQIKTDKETVTGKLTLIK